jgi:hypothetical protein
VDEDPIVELRSLAELRELQSQAVPLFLRFSKGPGPDADETSCDYESGLPLPGLSVNPLTPETWWSRPVEDWLARQICNYAHLREHDEERHAWVVSGPIVARGPDNEPLLRPVRYLAVLCTRVLDEAKQRYEDRFDVGRDSAE